MKLTILTSLLLALAVHLSLATTIPSSPKSVQPLEIGSAVPAVIVQTTAGESVKLDALTQGKPSVIIFYRGGWCPYCTRHLAALGEIEPELKARGYQILAISTDNAAHAAATDEDTDLGYQLLADSKMDAAKAFGLAYTVDQPMLDKLESYSVDIETASGETHHLLPVPAVFLTDAHGTITYRYFNADYTVRLSGEELLEAAE